MDKFSFDTLQDIKSGKHFYQFYKSSEDYLQVLIPYFQTGLQKGEACLWLVSERMGIDFVQSKAREAIDGWDEYLLKEQMHVIHAESWYLTGGRFDQDKSISNAKEYTDRFKAEGYTSIRAAGDAGAVPKEDWLTLHEYEKVIDGWIKGSSTVALCSYPIDECSLGETKRVLETHDEVLIGRI